MFVRMYVYNYVYIDMHSYIGRQMETERNFSPCLHGRCFGRHKTCFDFRELWYAWKVWLSTQFLVQ